VGQALEDFNPQQGDAGCGLLTATGRLRLGKVPGRGSAPHKEQTGKQTRKEQGSHAEDVLHPVAAGKPFLFGIVFKMQEVR
jgi:hypothetical protein